MSAIEDTRKVMQDFLAPELRAISARLDALEKRFEESERRQDKFADGIDKRFDNAEKHAERRHDLVMLAIARLADYNEVRDRLTRLESRESAHQ